MKTNHYSNRAVTALKSAALKAGVDLADITVRLATIEATWGDKDGLVVLGGTAELRERCARFLYTWCAKNLGKGSYNDQNALSLYGEISWLGNRRFNKRDVDFYSPEVIADYMSRVQPAYAVATKYYPCAE